MYTLKAGVFPQTIGVLSKVPIDLDMSTIATPDQLAPGIKQIGEGLSQPAITLRPIVKLVVSKSDNNKLAIFCVHFKARETPDLVLSTPDPISEQVRKFESIALLNMISQHATD